MKLLICCGGTGGHIYPGIAVAQECVKRGHECFFVGGNRLEKELVPKAGFTFYEIPVHRKYPLIILRGIINAISIVRKHRPQRILTTGGYVSFPVLVAALLTRTPFYVQEQNILPGKVNRFVGFFARTVFVSFSGLDKYFFRKNIVVTGNPVRPEIASLSYFPTAEKILVFGGSLAAKKINEAVTPLKADPELGPRLIHLDGTNYCHDMAGLYKLSCLAVCRAGATSLAELAAIGMPAILIPYPHAADNHQEINARYFEKAEAAVVLLDKNCKTETLRQLIKDTLPKCPEMSRRMRDLGVVNAAELICNLLLQ